MIIKKNQNCLKFLMEIRSNIILCPIKSFNYKELKCSILRKTLTINQLALFCVNIVNLQLNNHSTFQQQKITKLRLR